MEEFSDLGSCETCPLSGVFWPAGGLSLRGTWGQRGDSAPGLASGQNEAQVVRRGHGHLLPHTHTLYTQGPNPQQSLQLTGQAWAGTSEYLHKTGPPQVLLSMGAGVIVPYGSGNWSPEMGGNLPRMHS